MACADLPDVRVLTLAERDGATRCAKGLRVLPDVERACRGQRAMRYDLAPPCAAAA